jgi:hypothetical protein
MRSLLGTASLVACLLTAPFAWADGNTSPGKNGVWASASGVAVSSSSAVVLSAQIEKGKKKRVLEIEGTVVIDPVPADTGLGIRVTVNGLPAKPVGSFYQVEHLCTATFVNCALTGTWHVDLDAAELASPGVFINLPLSIDLTALVGAGSTTGSATIRARMVKK